MDQPNIPDRSEQVTSTPSTSDQIRNADNSSDPQSSGPATPAESAPPAQPLSLRGWFTQNGPFLLVCVAALIFAYQRFGAEWILMVLKAAIGLGFVIFIHELGHFLAAKWCDVHVLTFSIGFGPALPGCSFTRGETNYKIAMLPLGGYVNMIGEGPEADEDEDYPRSFKNKTVGQRMLIISAGVIMNILFGAIAFIVVYLTAGIDRQTATVYRVESGSPAWMAGVHSGWKIKQIGNRENPWFEQLRGAVALSQGNAPITFKFEDREGNFYTREIEPHKDKNNLYPVIGVAQPARLRLFPEQVKRLYSTPVQLGSATSFARVMDLGTDDVVLEASDPAKEGQLTPIPKGPEGWKILCERMTKLKGQILKLKVLRAGASSAEVIEVPDVGFDFDDMIVGTTDPAKADQPFAVSALPLDPNPNHPPRLGIPDPFAFRTRMVELAGKPIVMQVRRKKAPKATPVVNLLVPPAYHLTLGMRMKMGKVAAIRPDSPAEKAGLQLDDTIVGVTLTYAKETPITLDAKALDPVRLPWELEHRVREKGKDPKKWQINLKVRGQDKHNASAEREIKNISWDDSYSIIEEAPVSPPAPLSIPQLGIAYWIESIVSHVESGSPADKAGIRNNDEIQEISFRQRTAKDDEVKWTKFLPMVSHRGKGLEVHDQWAHYFWLLQRMDYATIRVKVKRIQTDTKALVELELPAAEGTPLVGMEAIPDLTWPIPDRGLSFIPDTTRQKAKSVPEAFLFGLDYTLESIQQIYMNLSSLIRGRISTKSLGGPIEIAAQAFNFAGEDIAKFALFLALISINLAVVNFLPIPVLDGGHMVFLIYEKIRGRPPSEMVRIVATYIGLAMILSLMIFVFWLDITRRFF